MNISILVFVYINGLLARYLYNIRKVNRLVYNCISDLFGKVSLMSCYSKI